jgi:hypothetical protein
LVEDNDVVLVQNALLLFTLDGKYTPTVMFVFWLALFTSCVDRRLTWNATGFELLFSYAPSVVMFFPMHKNAMFQARF